MIDPSAHSAPPALDPWEAAYVRFETPEEEIRKFLKRLRTMGAGQWSSQAEIVELFCGRGNGMHALTRLGFTNVEGVDLSPRLLAQYKGPASTRVMDCRSLDYADASRDILIVQGGMHHLPELPGDLERTVSETHRVLRPGGRFVVVEPWRTPFLTFVHFVSERRLARRAWDKLDAFATMTEHERTTYEAWLRQPDMILGILKRFYRPEFLKTRWGKLMFVGRKP